MTMTLDAARTILQKHWHHSDFRPAQATSIEHALGGHDVLAVLPTGYGKSCLFQVPAMMAEGTVIVVSPLISLMKDQTDDCLKRGIPASYVNSHVTDVESAKRLKALTQGAYKVFYVAPERFANADFKEAVQATNVSWLVLDECHCVSMWGHDFRPAYRRVKDIIPLLEYVGDDGQILRPPVMAFTATATIEVAKDIAASIGLDPEYKRVIADPIRPNLAYTVLNHYPSKDLNDTVSTWNFDKGRYIIYCPTQVLCQDLLQLLGAQHPGKVGIYHAGLKRDDRIAAQEAFKAGYIPLMVATSAFGMGIDVPNIRAVLHYGIPGSLEDYVQQAGRAGRDGLHSDCVLVYSEKSRNTQDFFIRLANPPYTTYQKLWAWMNHNLKPGEVLQMSGIQIARAMLGGSFTTADLNGDTINGALSTMNSHGLVRRNPIPYGTMATISTAALQNAVATGTMLSPAVKMVAVAMWDMVKETYPKPYPPMVDLGIDKETVAEAAGVEKEAVGRALAQMRTKGLLTTVPSEYGKTTQLLKPGQALESLLPESVIAAKRKRDTDRLANMMKYVVCKPGRHTEIIRQYFLGEEKE